ncbi:hypothetical protein FIBSPDRAFT_1008178 [Athelia psychrophila]|uniref:Uncharacterized protein n=1 Tax=Athelia psychrophila TaxID=1759441 RepID=A0A167V9U6_9AGAM|nr:hypothetical protein FIBSPDRAFT_1008178 [Fibularhizoctonia sp. CBS 109695]
MPPTASMELPIHEAKLLFFLQDITLGPRLALLTLQLVLYDVAVSSKKEPVELVGAKNESDGASSAKENNPKSAGRLKPNGPTKENSNDAKVTSKSTKSKNKSDRASSAKRVERSNSPTKENSNGAKVTSELTKSKSKNESNGVSSAKEDSAKEDNSKSAEGS